MHKFVFYVVAFCISGPPWKAVVLLNGATLNKESINNNNNNNTVTIYQEFNRNATYNVHVLHTHYVQNERSNSLFSEQSSGEIKSDVIKQPFFFSKFQSLKMYIFFFFFFKLIFKSHQYVVEHIV